MIWNLAIAAAVSVVVAYLAFIVVIAVRRPDTGTLKETMRIVPDTIRLVRRLASDKTLPRGVRIRLGLLLGYLASPIDLVPDFIPVLGYADDAIIVSLVLRSVIRRAGTDAVRRHWPGSPEGLDALATLCRIEELRDGSSSS